MLSFDMAKDYMLVQGLQGEEIIFEVFDEAGLPDDLTAYTTVRLVMALADFSANTFNLAQTDSEIDIAEVGKLKFTPSSANPIPTFGDYIFQIFREGTNINKPTPRFSCRVTREIIKV